MKIDEWLKTATKYDYIQEAICYFGAGLMIGAVATSIVLTVLK